jgi:hypothetical protein
MKKLARFAWRFLVALAIVFANPGAAAAANPDRVISGASYYVTLASGVAWNQLSANYIFTPESPNVGLCLFIENQNPTSAHTLTVTAFQTGNVSLSSYANSTALWATDSVQGAPTSIPHGSVASAYVATTGAANVAIVISGTSTQSGTPDTANVFAVQTTSPACGPAGITAVQGAGTNGGPLVGNPVLVGGLDKANNPANYLQAFPLTGAIPDYGVDLGGSGGISSTFAGVRTFGSSNNQALPAYAYGEENQASTFANAVGAVLAPTQNAQSPASLFTTNGGVVFKVTQTVTVSTIQPVTSGSPGVHDGCVALLNVTSVSGTSPSLKVYLQDSADNATWNDRIAFTTVTAVGSQIAAIAPGSINPVAPATNSLASGTVLNGNLAPFLRLSYVVAGTSPSFSLNVTVTCQ